MILSSHQPNFLPYMGFFYKAYKSDVMVISDDVLFSKKGMHNWNRIKTPSGAVKITLPVHAHHDSRLRDVELTDPEYNIAQICKTLMQNYGKAPHHLEGGMVIKQMQDLAQMNLSLASYNTELNRFLFRQFGIDTELYNASEDFELHGRKDERILQMCDELGADTYLSGTGAAAYHRPELFDEKDVRLEYSDFSPEPYHQLYGNFIPNLSVIDYIFNQGFELPREWRER